MSSTDLEADTVAATPSVVMVARSRMLIPSALITSAVSQPARQATSTLPAVETATCSDA
jgi:hypothetical protein